MIAKINFKELKKLLPFFMLYFNQGFPLGFLMIVFPLICDKEGISSKYIGIGISISILPTFLKMFFAPIFDKTKKKLDALKNIEKILIVSSLLFFAVGFLSFPKWLILLVSMFLFSMFTSIQDVYTDGLAISSVVSHNKGRINAVMGLGMTLGAALGNSLGSWISSTIGINYTFLTICLISILCFLSLKLLNKNEIVFPINERIRKSYLSILKLTITNKRTRIGLLVMLSFGISSISFGFTSLFLKNIINIEEQRIGSYMSLVMIISGIVGGLCAGIILKKKNNFKILQFSILVIIFIEFTIGLMLFIKFNISILLILSILSSRQTIGTILFASLYGYIMQLCNKKIGATQFAFIMAFSQFGTLLSSTLGGFILEFGWVYLYWGETLLMFLALISVKYLYSISLKDNNNNIKG